MMKRVIGLFFSMLFGISVIQSQVYYDRGRQISGSDSIAFSSSNSLSINPSYLAHGGKEFNIQLLQVGFSSHSDVLNREFVNRLTFSEGDVTEQDKQELEALTIDQFDFRTSFRMQWLGLSFHLPKFGGLSLRLVEQLEGEIFLEPQLTALFLEGINADWIQGNPGAVVDPPPGVAGSFAFYDHLRQLELGIGRKIVSTDLVDMYFGLSLSRLWGIGYLDLTFGSNRFTGNSAFSNLYQINYGDLMTFGEQLTTKLLSTAGSGWGYSGGFSVDIGEGLNIGIAFLDLGSVEYDFQTSSVDKSSINIANSIQDGIESYDFELEADYLYDVFQFEPSTSFSRDLDSRFRLTGLYSVSRSFSASADLIFSVSKGRFSSGNSGILGFNYKPLLGMVNFSSGVLYHEEFGFRWPFGVAGEFFGNALVSISTNDLFTLFSGEKNPLSSLSIATMQLKF